MARRKKSTFERLSSGPLNRKQRRDLGRRLASGDPGLTILHANAGGIDVGNESHFVAVPPDRDPNSVRETAGQEQAKSLTAKHRNAISKGQKSRWKKQRQPQSPMPPLPEQPEESIARKWTSY